MKKTKSLEVYVILGKVLCGIAGGILGFFIAGASLIIPGIVLGVLSGHFFKKSILSNVS